MNKGNENQANFKFSRFYIGGRFESLYLEKQCTLSYSNYGIKCFVIYFEAKEMWNKLALTADSLNV